MVSRNEVFSFLDKVRDSQTANIFYACKMLENHFGMTPEEAKMDFYQWAQQLQREEDAKNQEINSSINSGWTAKEEEVQETSD